MSCKTSIALVSQSVSFFGCVDFPLCAENQEEAFSKIHNLSSASLDQLHQIYEDEKESEES